MSFVINVMENDTLKYWKNKLSRKWYRLPFLMSKNLEIESFISSYDKSIIRNYEGDKKFSISSRKNMIHKLSKLAIVVPIYVKDDKAKTQVERLLRSIKEQNRKADFVILVDDCSPVQYDFLDFKVYSMQKNGGPAKARNKGIELAIDLGADIISFTDSDVILPESWLSNVQKFFMENQSFQAVSGKTIAYGKTWYDLYHNINGTLNGRVFKDSEQLLYGPTCNFSIVVEFIGELRFSVDFPLAAGEDIDFCFNFLKSGNNIGYSEKVQIFHDFGYEKYHHYRNKKAFISLFQKYAKGEKVLLTKIPEYYYFLNETKEISSAR